MADNPVRLQAREVSYHYPDGTAALGQIDLSIHDGEFIGLLGANGSGKTTLLKVLDGLIRDFKGTVTLDGIEYQSPDRQRNLRQDGHGLPKPGRSAFRFHGL